MKQELLEAGFREVKPEVFMIDLDVNHDDPAFKVVMAKFDLEVTEEEDPDCYSAKVDAGGWVHVVTDEEEKAVIELFGEVDVNWLTELVEELESI